MRTRVDKTLRNRWFSYQVFWDRNSSNEFIAFWINIMISFTFASNNIVILCIIIASVSEIIILHVYGKKKQDIKSLKIVVERSDCYRLYKWFDQDIGWDNWVEFFNSFLHIWKKLRNVNFCLDMLHWQFNILKLCT